MPCGTKEFSAGLLGPNFAPSLLPLGGEFLVGRPRPQRSPCRVQEPSHRGETSWRGKLRAPAPADCATTRSRALELDLPADFRNGLVERWQAAESTGATNIVGHHLRCLNLDTGHLGPGFRT